MCGCMDVCHVNVKLLREINEAGCYECVWVEKGVIEVCRNVMGDALLVVQN